MRKRSANNLMIMAVLLTLAISISYGRSMTLVYGGMELLLVAWCYVILLCRWRKTDPYLLLFFCAVTLFSLFNGLLAGEVKSVVLLSISLVLPLSVSALPLNLNENGRTFRTAFFVGLIPCVLQQVMALFGEFNSNTLGFLNYMCVSVGFVWYLCSKKKLVPALVLLAGFSLAVAAGSRNVMVVTALTILLLLLPKRWYAGKSFFRALYLLVLLYTVFAAAVMEWGFNVRFIADWLQEYTGRYSDKAWEMSQRVTFLHRVREIIAQMSPLQKLFGEGILRRHGHNMFYQTVMIYGYLGTVLIYAFYIRIFEMARKLVARSGDRIALGCAIALLGCFMLNGADVFLVGTETCAVIPQVLMGVIIYRYRNSDENLTQRVKAHERN